VYGVKHSHRRYRASQRTGYPVNGHRSIFVRIDNLSALLYVAARTPHPEYLLPDAR
jgi:hypothetical protein